MPNNLYIFEKKNKYPFQRYRSKVKPIKWGRERNVSKPDKYFYRTYICRKFSSTIFGYVTRLSNYASFPHNMPINQYVFEKKNKNPFQRYINKIKRVKGGGKRNFSKPDKYFHGTYFRHKYSSTICMRVTLLLNCATMPLKMPINLYSFEKKNKYPFQRYINKVKRVKGCGERNFSKPDKYFRGTFFHRKFGSTICMRVTLLLNCATMPLKMPINLYSFEKKNKYPFQRYINKVKRVKGCGERNFSKPDKYFRGTFFHRKFASTIFVNKETFWAWVIYNCLHMKT